MNADETKADDVQARWERMRQEERDEQLTQVERDTEQADRLAAVLAPQRE